MLPIFNTASEIGYGAVMVSLAAFATVQVAVIPISSNPLISEAVAVEGTPEGVPYKLNRAPCICAICVICGRFICGPYWAMAYRYLNPRR
jgi:hypothetical protein